MPLGYSFAGWYENPNGAGDPFDFSTATMPMKNIILYPYFETIWYLIKIDPNGGVIDHSAHILYSQIIGPGSGQIHPVYYIFVVFFIKGAHAVFTRRISDLFTADADGFVPVSELAKALGYTEDKTISKVTKMIRKGYLINCNYSANQRAFLLSDKIGAPTGMYQGAPANNPFVGVHCPGCAASLKIRANTMGTCPYCGRLITAPYYDQNTNTFR